MCVCVSQVEQKKQHASITEAKHSTLESQLQTEREALERKEKEVVFRSVYALRFFQASMKRVMHADSKRRKRDEDPSLFGVWSRCVGVTLMFFKILATKRDVDINILLCPAENN